MNAFYPRIIRWQGDTQFSIEFVGSVVRGIVEYLADFCVSVIPVVLLCHPNIFVCIILLDQLLKNEVHKYKPEGLAPYILNVLILRCITYSFYFTKNCKEKQTSFGVGHVPDISHTPDLCEVRTDAEETVELGGCNKNT